MKKFVAITVALILLISFCACTINIGGAKDTTAAPNPAPTTTAGGANPTNPANPTEPPDNPVDDPNNNDGFHQWVGRWDASPNYFLDISLFDGSMFFFEFYNMDNGKVFLDGLATIVDYDVTIANCGDVFFNIRDYDETIDVMVYEGSGWEHISTTYYKVYN